MNSQVFFMDEAALEETILDIILRAQLEGRCIGPKELSLKAGTYLDRTDPRDVIVWGFLNVLKAEGRVNNPTRGCWELTDKEFRRRHTKE